MRLLSICISAVELSRAALCIHLLYVCVSVSVSVSVGVSASASVRVCGKIVR